MYSTEFRLHWQHLLAAGIGMGVGTALTLYTTSLFAPALLAEFGWTKSEFALLGSLSLLYLPLIPFAGRFTDRYGPRVAASIGFTGMCAGYFAFPFMSGHILQFFVIYLLQHIFGIFTTGLVLTRVVVQNFDKARGIALSLMMTFPPLMGALAAPALGRLVDTDGWRIGYLVMAAITAVGGLIAVTMMGLSERRSGAARPTAAEVTLPRAELVALLKDPLLLLIAGGIFLVNIPAVIATSQLKLTVMSAGITSSDATWLASLYAMGVLVGRLACGLALDRFPAHLVAAVALGIPVVGYVAMASAMSEFELVALGVLAIGLAQGAETDLGAFLISRNFPMRNYSLLLSFVVAMMAAGTAAGSLLLSLTLKGGDDYTPFIWGSAAATAIGALMFGLTGRGRTREIEASREGLAQPQSAG